MRFVDDENLVVIPGWAEANILTQLAHFVDAAIGGGVDFDHIDRIALNHFNTRGTFATGVGGWALNTVEATSHNAGYCRFASSALPGKNVAVGNPFLSDCVIERVFDMLLTNQLIKIAGTILAGDNLIGHG